MIIFHALLLYFASIWEPVAQKPCIKMVYQNSSEKQRTKAQFDGWIHLHDSNMHLPRELNTFANNAYWPGCGNPATGQSRSWVSRCLPSSPEMLGKREAGAWPTIAKQPRLVVCWISSICRFWPFTFIFTYFIVSLHQKHLRKGIPAAHSCPPVVGQEGLVQPSVGWTYTNQSTLWRKKTPVCTTNYNPKHFQLIHLSKLSIFPKYSHLSAFSQNKKKQNELIRASGLGPATL